MVILRYSLKEHEIATLLQQSVIASAMRYTPLQV